MPNINVNDPDLKIIHISGFPQGVNEFETASGMKPQEAPTWLVSAKNITIRDRYVMRSAAGQGYYLDKYYQGQDLETGGPGITWWAPVRAAHRYRNSKGLRRILMVSGTDYAMDVDNGRFDKIRTVSGTMAFKQWRDTVIAESNSFGPEVFDGATTQFINLACLDSGLAGPTEVNTGGVLPEGFYTYRYTFDHYVGDTFMGETGALILQYNGNFNRIEFNEGIIDTVGDGDTSLARWTRPYNVILPPTARYINIYRQSATSGYAVGNQVVNARTDYEDFYWIGYVDVAELLAAPVGAVVFEDKGEAQIQDPIRLQPLWWPPRSRYMEWHKGRIWLMSPDVIENGEQTYTHHCDRIYWSRVGPNGPEPLCYHSWSWEYVGRGEPFDATGIKSIRNEYLLVTKPDSCWAVFGGDQTLDDSDDPAISFRKIDGSIGNVAPDSMHEVDGGILSWWSQNGPVYFDGNGPPRYLAAERIRKTVRSIPGHKLRYITASYSKKHRESTFFYSLGEDYNRHYSVWNWETKTWVHGERRLGISHALSVDDETSDGYELWFVEDDPGDMLLSHRLVIRADLGGQEAIGGTGDRSISGMVETPLLDGGKPFLDKVFLGVQLEINTPVKIHVDYMIDNVFDSSKTGDGFDMDLPVTDETWVWDTARWDISRWPLAASGFDFKAFKRANGATIPAGKGIALKLSWTNTSVPLEFSSATIFWKPAGVR